MLEKMIVRCSRDVLKFEHFAVLLLDEKTNRLNVIMSEGLDDDAWWHEMFATSEGNGICGYVVATGRSYVCPDVTADVRYLAGLSDARSSLTVPLRLNDKIIGAINIESRVCGAFNQEDRQFAEIFANYVALALNILNLLVTARHTAHTQLTGSICAELTGPLNDIISEITDVMEEYIGADDLRRRLSLVRNPAQVVSHASARVEDLTIKVMASLIAKGANINARTTMTKMPRRHCDLSLCWQAKESWWPTTRSPSARRFKTF